MEEVCRTPQPEWFSSNEIIIDHPAFFLRKFSSGGKIAFIITPQAGHSGIISDFGEGQSLVRTLIGLGFSVYVMDWKSCTPTRKNEGIEDLVKQVLIASDEFKQKFTLIGLCQGGWLSAAFTSLFPEKIDHLIVAGAPINAKIGGGYLQELVESCPQIYFEYLVTMGGGLMRGELMLTGWKMMNFADRVQDYTDLWCAVGTEKFDKIHHFRNWYECSYHLAGRYYLEAVDMIFRRNDLWEGRMKLLGRKVDLRNISCSITSIAGEKDDITLIPQALALPGKHIVIPEVGHIGIFMGRKSQEYWKQIFATS
ncbi:MAG: DUF3141 domain-containing protein [Candidatus Nealsonbacteria bacterium]|nr:DUF3141 domain-containing protein [Candidatus Nealsonbacteria bacterium]